jgi:hypothetical protein
METALFNRSVLLPVIALGVALGYGLPASAQPNPGASSATGATPEANRNQARQLATEGIAAQQRREWPTVIDRFERAEQLFHAPVHLRFLAEAYEQTAPPRLVAAAETWRRLSQEQLPADAPEPFRQAVALAQRELPRIEARLGRVVIEANGAAANAVVMIDGQPVPSSAFGSPRLVEPGSHHVTANLPEHQPIERDVQVNAGATERFPLEFTAVSRVVETPVAVVPTTRVVTTPNPLRTVGFITAGVGVAAVIGGAIAGVMAQSEFSDLEAACPNQMCATQADLDRRNSVDSMATASTGLLVAGGVLTAAGVVLVIVGKPRQETVRVGFTGSALQLTATF